MKQKCARRKRTNKDGAMRKTNSEAAGLYLVSLYGAYLRGGPPPRFFGEVVSLLESEEREREGDKERKWRKREKEREERESLLSVRGAIRAESP